jgi:hypothetical protein
LFEIHSRARIGGCEGLRSPKEIVDAVGTAVCRELSLKPVGTGRTPEEYVRDLRAERGFRSQDEGLRDAGGSRTPASTRLAAADQERTRRAIAQMRQARGFPPQS